MAIGNCLQGTKNDPARKCSPASHTLNHTSQNPSRPDTSWGAAPHEKDTLTGSHDENLAGADKHTAWQL